MAYQEERKAYPKREKTALDAYNLKLFGSKKLDGADKSPTLNPSLRNGTWGVEVWWTVYTNVESEKDKGKVELAMDVKTFNAFLYDFEKLINSPHVLNSDGKSEVKIKYEYRDFNFMQGKRTDDRMLKSTLIAGRNDKGIVYISVVSWSDKITKVPFFFTPPPTFIMHKGGQVYSDEEASNSIAMGWLKSLRGIIPIVVPVMYVPHEFEKKDDYRGGGNNNGGGGGYGNNSQRKPESKPAPAEDFGTDDFDDEMPM